nr:oligosaccharide flippase family protein [Labedella endophytica]
MFGEFAWVAIGRVIAALLQAAMLALVARSVLPEQFGLLSALLGVATFAQTASDLGIATFVLRERAREPDSPAVAAGLRVNQWTSLALAITSVFLIAGGALLIDPLFWFMLPLAVWAAAERNADTRVGLAVADGRAAISVINLVVRRASALVVFAALTLLGLHGVLAYSIAVALAGLGSAVWANYYVRRHISALPSSMRLAIRSARPFWFNSAAMQARNFDATIVGLAGGAVAAGLYSAASRLTVPLQILPTSMATVVVPASIRAVRDGLSLRPLARSLVATTGLMVAFSAALILVVPLLLPAILGDAYQGSVPVIQIVVAFLPFSAVSSLLTALLQGLGDGVLVAAIAVSVTLVCLALVLIGTTVAGPAGAAVGLGVSFGLQSVLLGLRVRPVVRRARRRLN